ncbi:epidermal growth factor receptor substrate 15-like 1 isoform X2 [Phalaenopsis equestris]|uniref:epidermal growth factor receptor substrate 15-like 1 isoform X2 n=1 Tax=Phalaenopsis equestris TaxID=78828 RepID=UPI0009E23A6D|nr:epidermal growth factor receptor substrate 15-like 1 isoform X2 [Phalaenopsis equestris]
MAAEQGQPPNADAFDSYFRRADLDQDGRISGAEAVAFFQGSNLPKETLALVWSYAAGGNSSLGRSEFYNALRLVTVAQSGRQLTADIVKAALYGPAAAKIPAPKINPTSPQANQILAQPTQTGFTRPHTSEMNSMAVPAPQTSNILPQSASAGFMRPPPPITAAPSPQFSMRPPQMNSMHTFSPQANSLMQQPPQSGFMRPPSQINSTVTSTTQATFMRPPASQNTDFVPITTGVNYQSSPDQQNHFMRPPQVQGLSQGILAISTGPSSSNFSSLSTDWISAHSNQEATSKPQIQHVISSSITAKPLVPVSASFQTSSMDSNALGVSGNGFSSNSSFGGDVFSAAQTKQDASMPVSFTSSFSNSPNSAILDPKNSVNLGQHVNLQVMTGLPPVANQFQRTQSPIKQNQPETIQSTSALPVQSVPSGPVSSVSTQNEAPWQKITQSDIRKYTKVFLEVDKDRDGKITGTEAKNLFLSWKLPRDILRQVWDLSDQDNDSMLSLREFCVALYLMERYREGRPLPSVLPNSVKFDQTLILATGQPSSAYGTSAWQQPRPVLSQQQIPEHLSVVPPSRMDSSTRAPIPSQVDDVASPVKPKARVPVLEQNMVNQLSEEEQKALNLKLQEATEADNNVQELEKEILECKQKTENYRKMMQELVLYKSRCDSRLNETIERTAADKREVELLAKKYEEKYKQTGDVASKLSLDQATFRDIQERKMELYKAIVKMEEGEISDGVLQERAEKIQNDLDELVKALNERCKDNGLRSKPTSLVELPFGWQPGMQEGAADWDESWDKFDKNDGFTIIRELTLEVENVVAPEKLKTASVTSVEAPDTTIKQNENEKAAKDAESASLSKVEGEVHKPSSTRVLLTEAELSNVHGEDASVRSPAVSPGTSTIESPSRDFQSTFSPPAYAKEHHSEFDDLESTISGEKFADEVTWGANFDTDDNDSLWGFKPIKTKEAFHDAGRLDSFPGHGDFALNSFGTDSPSASSVFGRDKGPFFDSVPSTPLFNSGFSPKFNEADDRSFDTFSRFDSFNTNDSIFPPAGNLTRFDSMRSTTDQSHDPFSRFDSFRSSADSQREFSRFDSVIGTAEPRRETLARFDSMGSTAGYNHGFSFDDSDPFGSGVFKTSVNQNPKKNTDQWSSF